MLVKERVLAEQVLQDLAKPTRWNPDYFGQNF